MEKQKEEKKVWIYSFIFLIFGLVLGLVIFNSGISGNAVFNVPWNKTTITPVETDSGATITDAPSENMLAMSEIIQGMSRSINFNKMSAQEWAALKDYADFSSLVTSTWTKENVAKLGEEGTLNLFNQKLKSSKNIALKAKSYKFITQTELNERLSKTSSSGGIGGGNQIEMTVGECHCGIQCCCAWGFWGLAQSCEGFLYGG